jgi:predicted TIM-barrel fold metal-dependent hydrolase
MKRYNIVKGFVSGLDLDIVHKWTDAASRRMIGSPFVLKPDQHDMAQLKQAFEAGRLGGIGEIGTQLSGIPANDPALEPYFALAEEFDLIPRVAFYDYLGAFVRAGLGRRLMFGSDQMRWPEKIGEGIEAIEKAPFLTEEQKRDILYNNAAQFLRLEKSSEVSSIASTRPAACIVEASGH